MAAPAAISGRKVGVVAFPARKVGVRTPRMQFREAVDILDVASLFLLLNKIKESVNDRLGMESRNGLKYDD